MENRRLADLLHYGRHSETCPTRFDSMYKPKPGCDCGFEEAIEAAQSPIPEQPVEEPEQIAANLAEARPCPGLRNVDLMQIATNAFCQHNPPGYNWSGKALEAACKAYHKAAISEQPVDTSYIAHKLEYAFPQISLSALSDIIEYFRPYLRQPEREKVDADDLERAIDDGRYDEDVNEQSSGSIARGLLRKFVIQRRGSDITGTMKPPEEPPHE